MLKDHQQFADLVDAIEGPCRPPEAEPRLALHLTGQVAEWTAGNQREVERSLRHLGFTNVTVQSVEEGNTKLILKLRAEDAERLFWAGHSGELDDLGFIDLAFLPPERPGPPPGAQNKRQPTMTRLEDLT